MAFNVFNKKAVQRMNSKLGRQFKLGCDQPLQYDIREITKRKIQKAVLGRGINVKIEDNEYADERMQEIIKLGLMEAEIYNMVGDAFSGEVLATIDWVQFIGESPRPVLVPCDMGLLSRMGYQYNERQSAVVWKKVTMDDKHFQVREHWTKKYVKRRIYYDGGKEIRVQDLVSKGIDIPVYEEHNLGILPVIRLTARKSGSRKCLADFSSVSSLEQLTNDTLRILYAEMIKNQTRIFGNIKRSDLDALNKQYANKGGLLQGLVGDMLVKASLGDDSDGTPIIQVIQGDPKLTEYWSSIKNGQLLYEQGIGLATANKSNGAEKTATEVNSENYETSELIQDKKHLLNSVLRQIIEIIIAYEKSVGFGDIYGDPDDIIVEINSASVMSEQERLDMQEQEMTIGIKSPIEVIAERRGITPEQAEAVYKSAQKYRVEEQELMNPEEPNSGDND